MNIFDIISTICLIFSLIGLVLVLVLDYLFPKEHPKYSTVYFCCSIFVTSLISVYITNALIEELI